MKVYSRTTLALMAVLMALACALIVSTTQASAADWSSSVGAKPMCGGTVSCCDSGPVFDSYKPNTRKGVLARRRACTGSGLECGIWHYVGSPSSGHWWMFIPCRG